ncbi:MAG: tRNA dimethylallyltransferase, partial [Clostridia bacterium]|nr:tRNA dimethylallyltransferase [Clostridia bacterium]
MSLNKLVSIVGTTASGKSSLGIELAEHYGAEIISADSRQVFRHLDLGTGKVTEEEMARVKHHLIDVIDLNDSFSMAEFQSMAYGVIDEISSRGVLPIMVGGTGLYTRSVVEGYNLADVPPDPALRAELEAKDDAEIDRMLS